MNLDYSRFIPESDVIIIGAGLSGLVAGYKILQHDPNLSIVILEATNRIGGHISSSDDGAVLGTKWVNTDQEHFMDLCKELNVTFQHRGESKPNDKFWKIDFCFFSKLANFELKRFLNKFDLMAKMFHSR